MPLSQAVYLDRDRERDLDRDLDTDLDRDLDLDRDPDGLSERDLLAGEYVGEPRLRRGERLLERDLERLRERLLERLRERLRADLSCLTRMYAVSPS